MFIYLDDANVETHRLLDTHPRIAPVSCDATYWAARHKGRPEKHQARQTFNANHAYKRARDLDWLGHIDVDEFLVSSDAISQKLASAPKDAICARIRPAEVLEGAPHLFKRPVRKGRQYNRIMAELYPVWGAQIKGGLLSHVLGKLFVRVGVPGLKVKIHNAYLNEVENPNLHELPGIDLAHLHAPDWNTFWNAFLFRLQQGSYRRELAPNKRRENGGVTLHEVFTAIHTEEGEAGLRAFFQHVCSARPELIAGLQKHGLLLSADLQLSSAILDEFPAVFDARAQDC